MAKKKKPKKRAKPQTDRTVQDLVDEGLIETSGIGPNTVVSLSPQGQSFYVQVLASCSQFAGRPVSGDDMSAIIKKMRKDMGVHDVDFTNPAHMERFKKELRGPRDQ